MPVLLYDGTCGLCAASVQFVLRHERNQSLRFAALESEVGRSIRARHPELATVDSMIWVEPQSAGGERLLVRSAAALRAAWYLGGPWRLATLGYIVPRGVRDALYDFIARHRHRLARGADRCYIPPPAVRARFLDQNG
jgi:predicted DCC family thiol-disulfide oxidoreductase YuxK